MMLLCSVQVTVFTSSRPNAGSTAALFVTLYGSKGPPVTSTASSRGSTAAPPVSAAASGSMANSGRCELKAPGSSQSRVALAVGSSCSFVLPTMQSLGQLRQLRLEFDVSGNQAGKSLTMADCSLPRRSVQRSCHWCLQALSACCCQQDHGREGNSLLLPLCAPAGCGMALPTC